MSEHLDELKKRLYKSGEPFDARLRRPELTPQPQKPPSSWQDEFKPAEPEKGKGRIIFWVIGVIFFLAASGLGTYFYLDYNAISEKKIAIEIKGPSNAIGGERVTWEISVTNKNKKALDASEFIFEYPQGSKVLDEGVRGIRARKEIGMIGPGETVRLSFNAFVFGFENEEKDLRGILEYSAEGSNANFSKEEASEIKITRSPVGISFETPQEIRAGQEVEIKLNYVSNSDSVLENMFLEVEFPSGYTAKESSPKPEVGGKTWLIPVLRPGEKGTIAMRGILSGDELEEKSFRAKIGVRDDSGESSNYGEGVATLVLKRPFMEIDAKISGRDSFSARAGDTFDVEVNYKNNLNVPVRNVIIEGTLSGRIIEEPRLRVQNGSYRSIDKKAIWNASTYGNLGELDPGETGTVVLQVKLFDSFSVKSPNDKELNSLMHFEIRPGVLPSGFEGTDLTGEDDILVKLSSRLQLVRRGLFYSSQMPNTGPLPPKVGQETTYAVILSLTNSTNDLDDVKVRAFLPPYVNWKNKINPSSTSISYDPNTGEIIWNVGAMKAGVGYLTPAREVIFQIGFIPSSNQVGQVPELVKEIRAEGRDRYAETNVDITVHTLTTKMESDPKIDVRHITVVK